MDAGEPDRRFAAGTAGSEEEVMGPCALFPIFWSGDAARLHLCSQMRRTVAVAASLPDGSDQGRVGQLCPPRTYRGISPSETSAVSCTFLARPPIALVPCSRCGSPISCGIAGHPAQAVLIFRSNTAAHIDA